MTRVFVWGTSLEGDQLLPRRVAAFYPCWFHYPVIQYVSIGHQIDRSLGTKQERLAGAESFT